MDNSTTTRQGSLEKRGIVVETAIDEDILTEASAKTVRFRATKPNGYPKPVGYAFSEVDTFVQDIVIPSLAWYQNALHERDKIVHKLGEDLDKTETDIMNLTNQIQYAAYNNTIAQGLQAANDDKEGTAILMKLEEAKQEIQLLKTQIANQPSGAIVQNFNVEDYEKAVSERDTFIEKLTEQYNELLEKYKKDINNTPASSTHEETLALKEARIKELEEAAANISNLPDTSKNIEELQSYITQITEQYNDIVSQYETDTSSLQQQLSVLQAGQENNTDNTKVEELQTYITQITEQYNELIARYETDTNQLQQEIHGLQNGQPSQFSGNEEIESLQSYIAEVTVQFNALTAQYLELAEENARLQNGQPSQNNAELGNMKVKLEAANARAERAEAKLALMLTKEEEEEDKGQIVMPLLSNVNEEELKKTTTIDPSKLPAGIKLSDLL